MKLLYFLPMLAGLAIIYMFAIAKVRNCNNTEQIDKIAEGSIIVMLIWTVISFAIGCVCVFSPN